VPLEKRYTLVCDLTEDAKELMGLLELEEELVICNCAPVQDKILQWVG
jgi:hypothetical protein